MAKQLAVRKRVMLLLMEETGVQTEDEMNEYFPLDELDEAKIFPLLEVEFDLCLDFPSPPPQTFDELLGLLETALKTPEAA